MRLAVVTDVYPVVSETFVANEVRALRRLGHEVLLLAGSAGAAVAAGDVQYVDARPDLRSLAGLCARRPVRCAADLAGRRVWRPSERPRHLRGLAAAARRLERDGVEHIHVHFAAGAAIDGLRLGRLLGVPVSITAHAYDIFLKPLNLERKLRAAAFATTGCAYNVRHLRALAPDADIHEIIMGVDVREFRRSTPHPDHRRVVAVGRLVEKKGFGGLVDAMALLSAPASLTIVGEGPARAGLEARVAAHGLGDAVELVGSRTPAQVKELLEDAALLAMPSVVAPDGDRDSMPVVVKEAMAMEVPVVASDEVGLPEIVDDGCGRLVPPGDTAALAAAIDELLALPVAARAALGRAGRERVMARCDVDAETARLVELIRSC